MRGRRFASGAAVLGLSVLIGLGVVTGVAAQGEINGLPGPTVQPAKQPRRTRPAAISPNATPAAPISSGVQDESYKLGSGDKLKMTVYGENDLSGEYLVDGTGQVQLPLLGQVSAAGMSVHDFEAAVGSRFVSERYLKDPRVSVEVENYRPFYIIGEVKNPGQYPYVNGMNALNAVALAGGYTYRADDSDVYIRRNGSSKEVEAAANQTTKIDPGDIIRIDERIF
jgi:polysaccharide export outer membrane protein